MILTSDAVASCSPVDKPPAGLEACSNHTERRDLLQGLHVLFVDDQEDVRRLVALVLKRYGAIVETVASAEAALAALNSALPDVLLSDIQMPHASGLDLIRNIRNDLKPALRNLPAAALSAHGRLEDRLAALDAGFQAYMTKPADPILLAEMIVQLVRPSKDGDGKL